MVKATGGGISREDSSPLIKLDTLRYEMPRYLRGRVAKMCFMTYTRNLYAVMGRLGEVGSYGLTSGYNTSTTGAGT